MYFIGIDPGVKGAIAIVDNTGKLIECSIFPTIKVKSAKGRNISRPDLRKLSCLFKDVDATCNGDLTVMVEEPLLMPGQAVSSTFNNGKSHGIVLTLITVILGKEPITVRCKDWQEDLITDRTPVASTIRRHRRLQLKKDSIAVAKDLFNDFDFKKSVKSKVDSDGMTDAALIAYYCYKQNG